jgi:hypothetical protein
MVDGQKYRIIIMLMCYSDLLQVDVEDPDFIKYPLFTNVQCHDCILNPGECLFIPRGWFHHVRGLNERYIFEHSTHLQF